MRVTRPDRLRAREIKPRSFRSGGVAGSNGNRSSEHALDELDAVEQVRRMPGFQIIREHCARLAQIDYDKLVDPNVSDQEAVTIRRRLIKNSAIESVVDEIVEARRPYDSAEHRTAD